MKLNFQKFKIYTSVNHKTCRVEDVREAFADAIYMKICGIKAHALALKIYNSEGEEDYNDNEISIIKALAEKSCLPGFLDGLNEQMGRFDVCK